MLNIYPDRDGQLVVQATALVFTGYPLDKQVCGSLQSDTRISADQARRVIEAIDTRTDYTDGPIAVSNLKTGLCIQIGGFLSFENDPSPDPMSEIQELRHHLAAAIDQLTKNQREQVEDQGAIL